MRDLENQAGESPAKAAGSPADRSRRAFVRKAALIGVPVVLATIPSRTVWARPRPKAGKGDGVAALDALSSGGSINPSGGGTAKIKSLL